MFHKVVKANYPLVNVLQHNDGKIHHAIHVGFLSTIFDWAMASMSQNCLYSFTRPGNQPCTMTPQSWLEKLRQKTVFKATASSRLKTFPVYTNRFHLSSQYIHIYI